MTELEIPREILALAPAPSVTPSGALSPSPYNFLFTGEDNLLISSLNSAGGVQLEIVGRMWSPDEGISPFRKPHTPTADRTITQELFELGTGYLLNASVNLIAGAPRVAQTFVRVQVVRGSSGGRQSLGTLMQGFVTSRQDLAWPGSPIRWSTDITPPVLEKFGTDPAAGVEVNESVPVGARWELITFAAPLTSDATVASRQPILRLMDVAFILWRSTNPGLLTASSSVVYAWGAGASIETTIGGANFSTVLPVGITLTEGMSIQTLTTNLQPGDNWGQPVFLVREWLEGN